MPSETMNSRKFSSSLFSFEDVSPSTMKQDEFWKSDKLSNCYEKNKIDVISTQHESNLFSSSLSELFNSKLKLSANSALYGHSIDNIAPQCEEEMVYDSLEELEAQTIGNLLPVDDDDLLAGLTGDHEIFVKDSSGDESDEQDLFASVGGMDLGHDDSSSSGQKNSEFHEACKAKLELYNTSVAREHPSRTLLVKNVASDVGDSELKALFEQFGGIQRVYNACKQCGFVLASYYDIRAAQNAMQAHRNGFFGFRTFDIQYLIPKDDPSMKEINQGTLAVSLYDLSITNNELRRMFRPFGEIKEIFETPQNPHHKLIEFYDVRAATAALEALNRNDTARKMLKVEPSLIGYSKRVSSSVPNGVLCNPSEFATNINIEKQERLDSNSRKFCQANYNAHPMELNDCVFESSTADRGLSLPRHRYKWSNSYQHVGMTWPNSSPSYFDGVCAAPTLPRFHGVHRSPPHMISNVVSMNNHLARSAPAANYNIWDRQHPYAGETHCLDFYPQNMFPSLGGNYVDLQVLPMDVGFPFHNHREMMFHGRHNMIPMINSFGTYKERARSRRQGRSTPVDTKQYELDIERIKNGEDNRTTLMIKNIPNKYTSKMLLAAIDECHKGAYDFVYLPIDFKNKCNMGYAFINMTNPSLIIPFYQEFNGKKWEKFNSEKVATLAYARIQGKAALIAHFQNSSLMNEDKRCRPILFNTDGPNAGDQIPFPVGENVRNKPVKLSPAAT